MKRVISIIAVILCIALCFTACKSKEKTGKNGKREKHNYDMTEYVTLGKYKGIVIDKSSELYKNYYKSLFENDVYNYDAYDSVDVIADGDIANINFKGTYASTGKEFEGGSGENYNLMIGSDTFIEGFEDQLIGVKKGETVVVKVTFPKDYTATELAGKPANFEVKVNSIKRMPEITEAVAVKVGFKNLKEYKNDIHNRVVESIIYETIMDAKKFVIKSYPEEAKAKYDEMYNNFIRDAEQQALAYNAQYQTQMTAEDAIYYMTEGRFQSSSQLKSYYDSMLKSELIFYAIFDAEDLEYTQKEYDEFIAEIAANNNVTTSEVESGNDPGDLEASMIQKTVMKFLVKHAKIK